MGRPIDDGVGDASLSLRPALSTDETNPEGASATNGRGSRNGASFISYFLKSLLATLVQKEPSNSGTATLRR